MSVWWREAACMARNEWLEENVAYVVAKDYDMI